MPDKNKTTRLHERATRRFLRATKQVSREQLKQAQQLTEERPGLTLAEALVEQGSLSQEEAEQIVAQIRIANMKKQEREDHDLATLLTLRGLVDEQTLNEAREKVQSDVTAGSLARVLAEKEAVPQDQLRGALEEVRAARRPKRRGAAPPRHGQQGAAGQGYAAGAVQPGYAHAAPQGYAVPGAGRARPSLIPGANVGAWQGTQKAMNSIFIGAILMSVGVIIDLAHLVGVIFFIVGLFQVLSAPDDRIKQYAGFSLALFGVGFVAMVMWLFGQWDTLMQGQITVTPAAWIGIAGNTLGLLLAVLLIGRVEAIHGNARLGDSASVLAVLVVLFGGIGVFLLYLVAEDPMNFGPLLIGGALDLTVYIWMAVLAKAARDSLRVMGSPFARPMQG